ncbi:ribosomal RNA methyltransferase E [Chloropicon primus]|uniref:Putative rRNA methyltransferase n=1 Tax=Chloropicon primus TaxID=1764295 RepID=A0A5B8MQZ5_9CHLO|nr:ribosomal RNA methyltransferase E [Chloropicon primus]UPR02067.1 ribosomal RNA methyltransferase E [Chloropicon primus]|eukprot:QDZ22843.1 ribosomal RNA methyltransferase E [Chloropicon primus]
MGKKSKGNQRLDKFYYLAKEQGYRSRAAFKLVQLNRKYGFLEKARSCLDLCAAPGGWLQVAQKHMPMNSLVVGVDLDPIKAIRGCITHQADITTERCRQLLRKEAKGGCYDIVIHDGAPNVGGNWASEAHMQNVLVLESLKLACEFLPPNGWFVTKVFRSVDYHSLLYAFNQLFRQVEATKPMASRYQSAEIFVVCGGFKAPGKIDPRLLDAKHLFNDTSAEPLPQVDVLDPRNDKKKRQRQGYEDGISTTYKQRNVVDFVLSENPVEMLGRTVTFTFCQPEEGASTSKEAGDSTPVEDVVEVYDFVGGHKGTTDEIKHLCKDLPVLGRSDFKHLLKWRTNVRKALEKEGLLQKKQDLEGKGAEGAEEEEEMDEETKLLNEMREVRKKMESRLKREKKKSKKMKQANKLRIAMSLNDEVSGIQSEQDLFNFHKDQLKGMNAADAPSEQLMDKVEEESSDSEAEEEQRRLAKKRSDAVDPGESKDRYFQLQDKYFELLYKHYKGLKTETKFLKKRSRLDDLTEIDLEEMDEGDFGQEAEEGGKAKAKGASEEADEEETAKHDSMAAKWFSQDVFSDINMDGKGQEKKRKEVVAPAVDTKTESSSEEEEEEDDGKYIESLKRKRGQAKDKEEDEEEDFEIVKRTSPGDGGDSSSDDESDSIDSDDTEALAHTMVLKKMFLKSKSKRALLESSYNKFAFHDEGLPDWFSQDEAKHMRPAVEELLPEEDLAEARDQLKAIDSRTIKKVAEAKARKKRKLWKRMETARAKANQIANSEDISARGKAREIAKLYAQAKDLRKKGKGKNPNNASLQTRERRSASGKPLDRRMFSDKRQVNAKQKKKDAKKAKKRGRR